MANQSKLKAWVRYDGTGRVISGGPIFQVNKPKVGNWKQIDANLCCNSTLTTTTTQGGGGGTPTAFVVGYWSNSGFSTCTNPIDGNIIVYSNSSVLQAGVYVYSDAALTVPISSPTTLYDGFTRYNFPGAPGELFVYDCPPSQSINVNISTEGNCGTVIANQTVQLLYTPTLCSTNESIPVIVGNFAGLPSVFYVTYNETSMRFTKVSDTLASGSYDFPCVSCG